MMYEYKATIVKIVDGDTMDLLIDLGFNTFVKERIRLARINAAEVNTHLGRLLKEHLQTRIDKSTNQVLLSSKKKDRYGRYIGEIIHPDLGNISDYLLTSHATTVKVYG